MTLRCAAALHTGGWRTRTPRSGGTKEIGTDATRLALDWAFNMLGLLNVMLETYEFNEQARRAYERAGLRVIGRRRDAVSVLGRRWDSILMDATAAEFESPVLGKLRPER
jgi:RimJ/RimL family protein N-acetyltransferase